MYLRLSCRRFVFFVRERSGLRDLSEKQKQKRYGARAANTSQANFLNLPLLMENRIFCKVIATVNP